MMCVLELTCPRYTTHIILRAKASLSGEAQRALLAEGVLNPTNCGVLTCEGTGAIWSRRADGFQMRLPCGGEALPTPIIVAQRLHLFDAVEPRLHMREPEYLGNAEAGRSQKVQ